MSERKTLIFGNGLGMALDKEFFRLDRSIQAVWEDQRVLDDTQRDLVSRCLPKPTNSPPALEDELEHLQIALDACESFASLPRGSDKWLTEDAKAFPEAVRRFLYAVARGFFSADPKHQLPKKFLDPLIEFVRSTRSHVATLNYDCLLYTPMVEANLMGRYDTTTLVDGMLDKGFDPSNLERHEGRTFGYYLHLHGSPLYVEGRDGGRSKINKLHVQQVSENFPPGAGSHLVLTHFKHKRAVIDRSIVLSTYWDTLAEAIQESDEVLLIGCSGLDEHLNRLIKSAAQTRIRVVEWSGSDDQPQLRVVREGFWRDRLIRSSSKPEFELIQLPSILTFTDWAVTSPSVPEPQY